MSVVAGKVYADKIVIAADSIVVRGWSKRTNFSKLQKINDMIIGGVGDATEFSLFIRFAQTHNPETATEKDVLAFIVEFSKWKSDYKSGSLENAYLLIFDKHLFCIDGVYVQEINDYEAIGAGEDYANAAMYLGHTPQEAVKTACELCCFVAEPIIQYEVERC